MLPDQIKENGDSAYKDIVSNQNYMDGIVDLLKGLNKACVTVQILIGRPKEPASSLY